jgi:hypothetical protein
MISDLLYKPFELDVRYTVNFERPETLQNTKAAIARKRSRPFL